MCFFFGTEVAAWFVICPRSKVCESYLWCECAILGYRFCSQYGVCFACVVFIITTAFQMIFTLQCERRSPYMPVHVCLSFAGFLEVGNQQDHVYCWSTSLPKMGTGVIAGTHF